MLDWKKRNVPSGLIQYTKGPGRERMLKRNPMTNQATRQKVSKTLSAMGHQPKIRGGNGKGNTEPQKKLANALGWKTEVVIKTQMPRDSGYPSCYKADIANEDLLIAVEVDGGSHSSRKRQAQDRKKDRFLRSLGWKVFRFTNRMVMEDLESCVQTVVSTI